MDNALTPTQHNPQFSTSPQITPEQVPLIAQAGYKTVINNRPDGEGGTEQPTSETIAKACAQARLSYHFLPVVSGQYSVEHIQKMANLLESAKQPVFCFCRSGTRSAQLYALAMQNQQNQ